MTSERIQAAKSTAVASYFCAASLWESANRTLQRPAHCRSAATGEPPARPAIACGVLVGSWGVFGAVGKVGAKELGVAASCAPVAGGQRQSFFGPF